MSQSPRSRENTKANCVRLSLLEFSGRCLGFIGVWVSGDKQFRAWGSTGAKDIFDPCFQEGPTLPDGVEDITVSLVRTMCLVRASHLPARIIRIGFKELPRIVLVTI